MSASQVDCLVAYLMGLCNGIVLGIVFIGYVLFRRGIILRRPPPKTSREIYETFAVARDVMRYELGPDERFLTPDDRLQPGDAYCGRAGSWWPYLGPSMSVGVFGEPVPPWTWCYTPKGKKERVK